MVITLSKTVTLKNGKALHVCSNTWTNTCKNVTKCDYSLSRSDMHYSWSLEGYEVNFYISFWVLWLLLLLELTSLKLAVFESGFSRRIQRLRREAIKSVFLSRAERKLFPVLQLELCSGCGSPNHSGLMSHSSIPFLPPSLPVRFPFTRKPPMIIALLNGIDQAHFIS